MIAGEKPNFSNIKINIRKGDRSLRFPNKGIRCVVT